MRTLTLNIIKGYGLDPVLNVSQFDKGYTVVCTVQKGAEAFTPPTGSTATVEGRKPDGTGYQYPATIDGSTVTFTMAEQMTVLSGRSMAEIVFYDADSVRIGTANFYIIVEAAPLNESTVISDTELPAIIDAANANAERAEDAADEAESTLANFAKVVAEQVEQMQIHEGQTVIDGTLTVSGAAADAKVTGDKVAELKNDLNELEGSIFETIENGIDVKDISAITKKAETSAIAYSSSSMTAISFATATAYDTYWFEVTNDCEIYTDVGSSPYYAIVHGVGFIEVDGNTGWLKCESVRRYRNSENNLPTESNKLTVHSGDVLAFTFPKDTSNVVYGLDSSLVVKDSFAKSVGEKLNDIDKPTVTVETNLITITGKKVKFYIRHIVDASVNVDCWRIYKGSMLDGDTEYVMWNGSDADGVIRLSGEDDFLGGFHGDEITTAVKLVIDGEEADLSTNFETSFSALLLFVESDIYHCNTSENAGIQCFQRNKIIEFKDGSLSVKNNFKAVKNVSVVYAHLAMLSCARTQDGTDIINSYTENYDYKLHSNTDTISPNSRLYKCSINTNCGLLVFEADKGSAQQYNGMVVSYDGTGVNNRLKWYFSAINESSASPIQLSNGDEIYGEYTLSVI